MQKISLRILNKHLMFLIPIIMIIVSLLIEIIGRLAAPDVMGSNIVGINSSFMRIIFYFSYFTILSNIMVACWLYCLYRQKKLNTPFFHTLRLIALAGITITMIIFHFLIRPYYNQYENLVLGIVADIFHILIPIWAILVWILIDSKKSAIKAKHILFSYYFLLAYSLHILILGLITNYYPYTFIDYNKIDFSSLLKTVILFHMFYVLCGVFYFGINKILIKTRK